MRGSMCVKYGIHIKSPITVRMVSSAEIASRMDRTFTPTPGFDARAVGVAVNSNGKYTIYLENGAPRLSLIETISHELTHIWQYSTWNWEKMEALYGDSFLAVCEGMAKWVELQYLFLANEAARVDEMLLEEAAREDVYGYGLRLYLNRYPMSRGVCLESDTPFDHPEEPLDL